MKNLNEIITKYGSPDILIDSWENEFEGYAIWEYEDYILWNDEGLYHSNKKNVCFYSSNWSQVSVHFLWDL